MGNFKQTSNVSITITKEYTSRSAVNNEEAHTKQLVMSGNAKQEFKKYNYEFPTQFSNMKYRDVIWKNLRTGTKYDKSSLTEEEFWAGRVYKSKNCGKTTTYLESMTFAPPWRIHPDEIDNFLQSHENMYFEDIVNFLKSDEQFKGCIFLRFQVHMDEVYIPESITLEDGTEKKLEEDERWMHAYIKPHLTVDYIPTVYETDKEGHQYRQLSRTKLWKSKEGRYNQSYAEFNTRKYEVVDRNYGLERGELYADRKPEEQPIKMSLEEYQRKSDEARVKRLIEQQQEEIEKTVKQIEDEAKQVLEVQSNLAEAKREIKRDVEHFTQTETKSIEDVEFAYVILEQEKNILLEMRDNIYKFIAPLKMVAPRIYEGLKKILDEASNKIFMKELFNYNYSKNNNDSLEK